ncbi:MAG: UbiA family prenyltransferase [bacterium]|nr:UbiA family prenyltransferase [bacterium]
MEGAELARLDLVPLSTIRTVAADIKIAHSVFALPFAILAAFMAAASGDGVIAWGDFWGQLILVVVAMVFARTAAMLANRILDASLDARNPRTAGRAIPSGKLSIGSARGAWVVTALLFMGCCALFGLLYGNWWPLILGLPVLLWISLYGLAKRFTQFCHVWLGSSLALSPVAAALAIRPDALASPSIWLLSVMVLLWVAGFDVIYALQDVEVDRRDRLHSMPGTLGVGKALMVARLMHVGAVAALVLAALTSPVLGPLMMSAAVLVALLLLYEHLTVARWGTTKMALAFFTLNGMVSCLIGLAGVLDITIG